MSDFEDILNAPNQEASEAALFKWTSRMLGKWRATGINELEAKQLLQLWGGKEQVATAWERQRKRERRFEKNGKVNRLQYAAIVFEKDERTIRRWCKRNHFPGAKLTKGGHWRIPLRVVEEVRKRHPNGFGRGAKRLFGTKTWKEFKKDLWVLFGKRFTEASAMEAALQDKSQSEFLIAPVPFTSEALDKLKIVVDKNLVDYANLRYLARRLYKEAPNRLLNFKLLADALHINASTLYRRYTKTNIRSAIKSALKPLRQWEIESKESTPHRELSDAEKDAEYIQNEFNQIEVQKDTPSPYLPSTAPDEP